MANKRLGMVIDTKRCIGCHTCAVACKVENNLPDTNWWNRVLNVGGWGEQVGFFSYGKEAGPQESGVFFPVVARG